MKIMTRVASRVFPYTRFQKAFLFICLISLLFNIQVTAQFQRTFYVNNTPGVAANFVSLQAALDSIPDGSTIILQPSVIAYNPVVVRKKVNIIGNGYFFSGNKSSTPATALQAFPYYSKIPSLHFRKGSEGSQIMGLDLTQSSTDSSQANIYFDSVSNITVQNCYLEPVKPFSSSVTQTFHFLFTSSSSITIRQCYINHTDSLTAGCWLMNTNGTTANSNIYFQNNIIVGKAEILPNGGAYKNFFFDHNTFITTGGTFNIGSILFTNNIFFKLLTSSADTTVLLSSDKADTLSSNNISNFAFYTNSLKNKIVAVNYSTDSLFLNKSPIPSSLGIDDYYQLKGGSNPAKTYGSDTTDCGAFGGRRPYILSGIPPVPNIYVYQQSVTGDPMVLTVKIQIHGNTGVAGDTSLKVIQGEYFYDKDPGVGVGYQFLTNFSKNDVTVNTTIGFDTAKANRLYVRFKDQNGFWSVMKDTLVINPRLPVYKTPQPVIDTLSFNPIDSTNKLRLYLKAHAVSNLPNDTLNKVVRLEYYFDQNDPGIGKGYKLSIINGKNISFNDTIPIPDNSRDVITLNVRVVDNLGVPCYNKSTVINLCKVYPKTIANFGYILNGSLFSLIDSSKNNPLHVLRWYYNTTHFIDTVQNPTRYLPFGFDTLKLYSGTGCRMDSITKIVNAFAVEGVYPKTVQAGGDIHIQVNGSGFDTTNTLTIIDSSGNQYQPTAYDHGNQNLSIGGSFDFHKIQINSPQLWDIRVTSNNTNVNKIDTVLKRSITVLPKPADSTQLTPIITVSWNVPQNVSSNTLTDGSVTLTNYGNVISKLTQFDFYIDSRMQDFQITNLNFDYPKIFSDSIQSILDQLPQSCKGQNPYFIDGLNSYTNTFRHYSILIPNINPGQPFVIKFKFSTPSSYQGKLNFFGFAKKRLVGSGFLLDAFNSFCYGVSVIATTVGLAAAVIVAPEIALTVGIVATGAAITIGTCQIAVNSYDDYVNKGLSLKQTVQNQTYNFVGTAMSALPLGSGKVIKLWIAEGGSAVKLYSAMGIACNHVLGYAGTTLGGIAEGGDGFAVVRNYYGQTDNSLVGTGRAQTTGVGSFDPNEITGPSGFDSSNIISNRFIDNKTAMNYKIEFENDTSANRAAQRIVIKDTLNPLKFDLSTFQLLGFTIGDSAYTIPNFLTQYSTTVNLVSSQGVLVRFNAKLDTLTGILSTNFTALDPRTLNTVSDTSLLGFLPPDLDRHSGKGSVSYIVKQNGKLINLDTISNKATIYFDNNTPMTTSPWKNTIDINPPSGKAINYQLVNDSTFTLNLQESDKESGIGYSQRYYSVNKGAFKYGGKTNNGSITYIGAKDSTYDFYSIPFDNVGNNAIKNAVSEVTVPFFNTFTISGDSTICEGSKTTYTDSTKGGVWKSSNTTLATIDTSGNILALRAGTDTITYSVTKSGNTVTQSKTLKILASPKPLINWNGAQFSTPARNVLYQWLLNNSPVSGATDSVYKPISIGAYKIKVTAQNTCVNTSDSFLLIVTAVSTPSSTPADHIARVTPNPASSIVQVSFMQTPVVSTEIQLVSLNGSILQRQKVSGTINRISINNIAPGIYYIKIIGKGYDQTQELIITR
jgi:hypothetical protein